MIIFKNPGIVYVVLLSALSSCAPKPGDRPLVQQAEYIYALEDAPTPECHASTIAVSGDQLVASWFAGTKEKNKDVGIWVSIHKDGQWSTPREVVNGVQNDTLRYPCWNPVLFQPEGQPLLLYYKVGPSPREWWGMVMHSDDHGQTWSAPQRLPDGILGPIKNKPVALTARHWLSPTSTEHDGWKVHMEITKDAGATWTKTGQLNDGFELAAIQPTVFLHPDEKIQILCRTKQGFISESWSTDGGQTWTAMDSISLPNPNSGIDGVTLADGRHLLVYNPTSENWGDRVPLNLAISEDGQNWKDILVLEEGDPAMDDDKEEYSYPSIIQGPDGLVHIVYTWNRKTVKYVRVDPEGIE